MTAKSLSVLFFGLLVCFMGVGHSTALSSDDFSIDIPNSLPKDLVFVLMNKEPAKTSADFKAYNWGNFFPNAVGFATYFRSVGGTTDENTKILVFTYVSEAQAQAELQNLADKSIPRLSTMLTTYREALKTQYNLSDAELVQYDYLNTQIPDTLSGGEGYVFRVQNHIISFSTDLGTAIAVDCAIALYKANSQSPSFTPTVVPTTRSQGSGITLTAQGRSPYQIGGTISISGTNTVSGITYLFMIGPSLDANGVPLTNTNQRASNGDFTEVIVDTRDKTWHFSWNTGNLKNTLPPGTYTIYAVPFPYAKNHLEGTSYSTQTIEFVIPGTTISPATSFPTFTSPTVTVSTKLNPVNPSSNLQQSSLTTTTKTSLSILPVFGALGIISIFLGMRWRKSKRQ